METVNIKFNNFKTLCNEIDSLNDWVVWFVDSVDLTSFLLNIKSQNHLEIDEIYEQLIITTKLQNEKVEPHSIKIKRYIEYFKSITNII